MRLWKKHPQLETDRGKSNSASGSDDFAVRVITDMPVSLPLGICSLIVIYTHHGPTGYQAQGLA